MFGNVCDVFRIGEHMYVLSGELYAVGIDLFSDAVSVRLFDGYDQLFNRLHLGEERKIRHIGLRQM